MIKESSTVAVLFADIARSTHLYEVLGDKQAKALIRDCIALLSKVTLQFHGCVIKTIGDEILCTFPGADDAVNAGKAMHEAMEQLPCIDNPVYTPPNIYVGIHYGPVIEENGDIFGDTVNMAARLVDIAKQRQIIASEQTVALLNDELRQSARYIDKITIKGKSGEANIFEVVWEKQDLTMVFNTDSESQMTRKNIVASLVLQYHDHTITVEQNRPVVTLGRQNHNDIVVCDGPVSRSHARIEYRRGKFLLIDQSTNGTYIQEQGKKMIRVKQLEMPLNGDGIISLGREPDPDMSFVIRYENSTHVCFSEM